MAVNWTGTADEFMRFALDGHVTKDEMAEALEAGSRQRYLAACAEIERTYTHDCSTSGDPCLESGCSIDREAGEVCLQPVLRAGDEYQKACAEAWVEFFRNPSNRVGVWQTH